MLKDVRLLSNALANSVFGEPECPRPHEPHAIARPARCGLPDDGLGLLLPTVALPAAAQTVIPVQALSLGGRGCFLGGTFSPCFTGTFSLVRWFLGPWCLLGFSALVLAAVYAFSSIGCRTQAPLPLRRYSHKHDSPSCPRIQRSQDDLSWLRPRHEAGPIPQSGVLSEISP